MVVQRVTKEGSSESKELSNFIPWAERFLYSVPKSHTNTAVVMVALTYLERAVLPSHFSGKDPLKSVFLGAVILAVKVRDTDARDDPDRLYSSIPGSQAMGLGGHTMQGLRKALCHTMQRPRKAPRKALETLYLNFSSVS